MVKATFGLDENVAAAATYLLGWVTGIIFLVMEKENKTIRFHAAQSIAVFVGLTILYWIISGISMISLGLWALFSMVSLVISIVAFLAWLFLMFKAYSGEKYKVPVAGDFAEQYS
jgi:uncharacterized membrane protein